MPKFSYSAVGPDGATITGVEDALSVGMARRALVARDFEPIAVEARRSILTMELTKKKVPRREIMHFSRQMAVFIRAGVPILDSIDTITEEMGDKTFQKALAEMSDSLRSGETFATAAAEQAHIFPPYYIHILHSAELTGNLDIVLDRLAEYIDRDGEAKRKISAALMYPAVVLVMAILAVVVIVSFVLPRFVVFFQSLNAKLPLVTRLLLDVAHFVTTYWYLIVGFIALLGLFAVHLWTTTRGRQLKDQLLLKIPVGGELVRCAIIERFCRILAAMVSSGVALPEALAVTADASNNYVYKQGLTKVRDAMMRGEGLAGPLTHTDMFPPSAKQMFRVGEATGTLDQQLETAAIYFERELDFKLKRFTSLFEPAVIIFVGVVVGFVAIALVSAMYGIFRQVKIS
jgi:type IV pilus assembly protein PilC